jgi:hypothetical protein
MESHAVGVPGQGERVELDVDSDWRAKLETSEVDAVLGKSEVRVKGDFCVVSNLRQRRNWINPIFVADATNSPIF